MKFYSPKKQLDRGYRMDFSYIAYVSKNGNARLTSRRTNMSTRAVYSFIDNNDPSVVFHVYKHHDGYPTGAAGFLQAACVMAWKLPRYEADEFGASFIRANKDAAGGVRLTNSYEDHGDLDYRYEISQPSPSDKFKPDLTKLWVRIFECKFNSDEPQSYKEIGFMPLDDMPAWAVEYETKASE